jgi:hypothetical protein
VAASDRALEDVLAERSRHERELGDPAEARAERDGIERALTDLEREQAGVRRELAGRDGQDRGRSGREVQLQREADLGIGL